MTLHVSLWSSFVFVLCITIMLIFRVENFIGNINCGSGELISRAKDSHDNIQSYNRNFGETENEVFLQPKVRRFLKGTLPLIYVITPTVHRGEQIPDLTRMSHTLRLVPRLHWILVEDTETKSEHIERLLNDTGLQFTHLAIKAVEAKFKPKGQLGPHKGDTQRNYGIDWISNHGELPSVFYLADDDNTYSVRLFEELRYTKRVSVWPVGLVAGSKYESPIVKNGKVVHLASGLAAGRKFPIDMAGFAVNSELLKRQNSPRISSKIRYGHSETSLLEQLNVTLAELEPRADNCTKILVWHTKTLRTGMSFTHKVVEKFIRYNVTQPEY